MKEEIFDFDKHKGRRIKDLILGKFNIGDIVVNLNLNVGTRLEGDIFKVLEKFPEDKLYLVNNLPENWRLATPEEIEFYKQGGKNINDMKSKLITIPKYWCIKNDYQEVRDYLAETYKVEGIKKWLGYPYIGFDNTCANNGCHGCSRNTMENNAIEITIDQFNQYFGKKESVSKTEEFVLPEKWCIRATEKNVHILKQTTHCNKHLNYNYTIGGYYGTKFGGNSVVPNGYTEITFEQFKKYVLKETITKVDLSKQEPMKTAVQKEEELKVGDYAVVLKGYRGLNNPFEITNAQENINILPKPKELEIVPISKYFKIRN